MLRKNLLVKNVKGRRRLLERVVDQRNFNCMTSSGNKARNKCQSSS